jgi:hypothetical protein
MTVKGELQGNRFFKFPKMDEIDQEFQQGQATIEKQEAYLNWLKSQPASVVSALPLQVPQSDAPQPRQKRRQRQQKQNDGVASTTEPLFRPIQAQPFQEKYPVTSEELDVLRQEWTEIIAKRKRERWQKLENAERFKDPQKEMNRWTKAQEAMKQDAIRALDQANDAMMKYLEAQSEQPEDVATTLEDRMEQIEARLKQIQGNNSYLRQFIQGHTVF